ncbi:unnamed protein product [Paramecium sonneborni]|uniref:MORN repeat protein n=1 Tax=Paramecium sonneborni TaxID=65129 RepID=A0A8S1RC72_9CILI|nr:unnamed protein product [Paramecium sonneborni]
MKKKEQFGGGLYDELNGCKTGKWIELGDQFLELSSITQIGEYRQGLKIDKWEIYKKDYSKRINHKVGGGTFNEQGQKTGYWIQLDEKFYYTKNMVQGEYIDGRKIGKWHETAIDHSKFFYSFNQMLISNLIGNPAIQIYIMIEEVNQRVIINLIQSLTSYINLYISYYSIIKFSCCYLCNSVIVFFK